MWGHPQFDQSWMPRSTDIPRIRGPGRVPNYCMMDAVGQRPTNRQPVVLGNSERTKRIRQCCEIRFLCVEDNIVAAPMLNLKICDNFRAHGINRNVSVLAELFPPIFKGLLVDVVFAALAGDCGFPPDAQPCALAASKIDDAVDRQQRAQQRYDLLRRMNRKVGREAVEIVAVFVQLALLPRYGELTFVCSKPLGKNEEPAASSSR